MSLFALVRTAVDQWIDHNAPRLAAALAFYTLLSITPLFVIVTAIIGFVFGEDAANGQLVEQLRSVVGDSGAEVIESAVVKAHRPTAGVIATIIGVATLLFGASGVFGELQSALNTLWGVKAKPGRGIRGLVRDRFLSFGMVLVVGFLLLVLLLVSAMLTAFGGLLERLGPGFAAGMILLNLTVSILVVAVLFAMMFKYLPDVVIQWRDVWLGAFVTALLFTGGKYVIGLYLGTAGVGTPFGAAGSLVALVVWVYYSGMILLFGAELTRATAARAGRRIEPSANAVSAEDCEPKPQVLPNHAR